MQFLSGEVESISLLLSSGLDMCLALAKGFLANVMQAES